MTKMKPNQEQARFTLNPSLMGSFDRLFVLTDENTLRLCWPKVEQTDALKGAIMITIGCGEEHKSIETVEQVWTELQHNGASRHSLMINLGGGMVTDLGGFAASTFKRGMPFINIPTTLLAMVDASAGGKTGVNFGGLKNEVGVFCNPRAVIIDPSFLETLDSENLLSGYAEMLKHALLTDKKMLARHLTTHPSPLTTHLSPLIEQSIEVKSRIVEADPKENGLRKALNLGHTAGHAFESFAMEKAQKTGSKPLLHGYAVAYGLIVELYLSTIKCGFPQESLRQVTNFVKENYGRMAITCKDYPTLTALMKHDKKNTGGAINFTLLSDVGEIKINQTATITEIEEALDFYREC